MVRKTRVVVVVISVVENVEVWGGLKEGVGTANLGAVLPASCRWHAARKHAGDAGKLTG